MTPRPFRLLWLTGLAGAALTLNAQTTPATPPAADDINTSPSPLTPKLPARLVPSGNPNAPIPDEWNLTTVPLSMMSTPIEELTGRTVLRANGLPNTEIALPLKKGTTRAEALQALETVLNLNQIVLIPLGEKFIKLVPIGFARQESAAFIEGSTHGFPPSGQIASKLFQLEFLRINEFMQQASALLNQNAGGFVTFEKANAVLVTDSISNLQRIEALLEKLDQPITAGVSTKFYTLHFAKATDLVTKLNTIIAPLKPQLGSNTSFNPDDRTNQIVLICDARQFPFFDDLITKLDVKADPNTRNEVIYLKHAEATKVATTLSTLVSGVKNAQSSTSSLRPGQIVRTPANAAAPAVENAPAPVNANPAIAAALNELGASTNEFSSYMNIQSDERSNAVIVSGTLDDIRLIKDLIDKLDIILAQVRIEVVIAEVVLSDDATSGISALGLSVTGDRLTGVNGSTAGLQLGGAVSPDGITGGTFASIVPNNLAGIVSLSTTPRKSNSSILSVPTITSTHNKEAIIFFGETRPVISGSTSTPVSGSTSTSSTVTPQEIGTKITVKPLIGNDGSVQLDIKQVISDVTGEVTIDGNKQYIIGKRETTSFLSVKSGEIIVLGGMQKQSSSKSSSRLGPIPIIGDLLGTRSRGKSRTELVFFIRPTVLTNTAADNAAALKQVDAMPIKDEVRKELDPNYQPKPGFFHRLTH